MNEFFNLPNQIIIFFSSFPDFIKDFLLVLFVIGISIFLIKIFK